MIVRLQKPDGEVELDEDEDGKLVGFRINDSDLPELVWEQDVRALMSKGSSPGHVFGQFQISREVPGMVADGFRQGGRDRTRYRAIDPETGELGSPGYSFDASTAPQVPTFALSPVNTSIAGPDSALFTSMHDRGELRPRRVNRIDLDSGTVAWSWTLPGAATPTALTTIDVVSLSPDGSLVYVRANVDVDSRLWELDAATGEPLRNWRFSQELPQGLDLTSAPVTLDGGDVFQLIYTTSQASVMAALYR
jgi:outer membrane protein assembly factor BamB